MDLMVMDEILYLHLINKITDNTFIIVDDCNSKDENYDYNFIPNLKYISIYKNILLISKL